MLGVGVRGRIWERNIVSKFLLTHICLVDYAILINWTSPFPILGVSGVLFHFFLFRIDIPVSKQ